MISFRQKFGLLAFGFFISFVLIEAGLRIGGYAFLLLQEWRNKLSIDRKGTYRIICLGESTTAFGGENAYPHQLEKILNQKDIGIKFSVINKGIPATNTAVIAMQLPANLNKYNPDMVITMMGINDGSDIVETKNLSVAEGRQFYKTLRIYNMVGFLVSRIQNKIKEIKDDITINRQNIAFAKDLLRQNRAKADSVSHDCEKNLEIAPSSAWDYIELGRHYNRNKDYQKAEEMLKKAIGLNPNNDAAYIELGACYRNIMDDSKAEDFYKKAIEINPKNEWAYIELGRLYKEKGGYDKAEEMFRKAIELNPENDASYIKLGIFYKEMKKYDKFEEMIKKAIEINPNSGWAYIELGRYHNNRGCYYKSETMLRKAIELDPKNEWGYIELGLSYKFLGKIDKAEYLFKKAIEINPKNEWAYMHLWQYYKDLGDEYKAEAVFKQCAEEKHASDFAYIQLGTWYYKVVEDFNKARENFEKAIELNPRSDAAYINLSTCYMSLHDYDKAIEVLTKAIPLNPRNEWSYIELGQCYNSLGKYEEAEKTFEKAVEVNSKNEWAYIPLIDLIKSSDRGDYARLEQILKKGIELNPGNDKLLRILGQVYEEQGKTEAAIDCFQKAQLLCSEDRLTATGYNYKRVRDILAKRGVRYVCVQYPMRNVEPLKRLLEPCGDIIFVDNERIFKEAVNQGGFRKYFGDMFGGDFGHCTPEGNRLLAENIANAIKKEVFKK